MDNSKSSLAPLQTFDPSAFQSDSVYSQGVCDVILGLALLYNDVKDTMAIIDALRSTQPGEKFKISCEWGEYVGRDLHILRHHVALLNELFQFIQNNIDIINLQIFQNIVKQMPSDARTAWQALVDTSMQKTVSGSVGKILVRLRNNISFHYNSSELSGGFKKHFIKEGAEQAFISIGKNMAETRFYFADAAIQDYINFILGDMKKEDFQKHIKDFFTNVNKAFYNLVHSFIMKRGCSYRLYNAG